MAIKKLHELNGVYFFYSGQGKWQFSVKTPDGVLFSLVHKCNGNIAEKIAGEFKAGFFRSQKRGQVGIDGLAKNRIDNLV